MKALTIRNIPDDVYQGIVELAPRNDRSIQQQVLAILERARVLDTQSPVEKAREIRKRLYGRELGDTEEEIRQERER